MSPSLSLYQAQDPAGPLSLPPGNPSPPRAGRVSRGARRHLRDPPSRSRPTEGASGAGLRPAMGRDYKRLGGRRGHREGITAPLVKGGRAADNAAVNPAHSSHFCRDRRGASGSSRGAAGEQSRPRAPSRRALRVHPPGLRERGRRAARRSL